MYIERVILPALDLRPHQAIPRFEEVAVEALREGWRARKFTIEQLAESARICRVHPVIQAYLEMRT